MFHRVLLGPREIDPNHGLGGGLPQAVTGIDRDLAREQRDQEFLRGDSGGRRVNGARQAALGTDNELQPLAVVE